VVDATEFSDNVYVEFSNRIPYVSKLINKTSWETAERIEANAIKKQVQMILQKQADKLNRR
jgi:hypothetical protein